MNLKSIKKDNKAMINTKEDLDKFYKDFYEDFSSELNKKASHVASIFKKINPNFDGAEDEVWYLAYDSNYPNEKYSVCCDYDDYFGDTSYYHVSFEPKWLFATDEELEKHVADVLEERERKKREELQKEAEEKRRRNESYYKKLISLTKEELLKTLGVPDDMIEG